MIRLAESLALPLIPRQTASVAVGFMIVEVVCRRALTVIRYLDDVLKDGHDVWLQACCGEGSPFKTRLILDRWEWLSAAQVATSTTDSVLSDWLYALPIHGTSCF